MRKPIDLGDCIRGRKLPRYLVGQDYDWTYRLCWIKATADYSAFYWMCELQGPILAGPTLKAAIEFIDAEHAKEGALMPEDEPELPENVHQFPRFPF